ncbi:uncharacterized protein LOC129291572 isoform X3 [Prosopis cineraria]|uniref:uncharacterized protein LOC129291572 isoform X3 n=1 Tax=Prosopis cineraria TaxID=364024 RepID=UPI00240F7FD3|nr:uncharacterized protein LOC129291572 isoform X3 [Prosopis cineraria]
MWSSGHINVDGIVPPSSFFLIGILFRPKSFSPQNPISFPSSVALLSRSSFRLSAVAVDCFFHLCQRHSELCSAPPPSGILFPSKLIQSLLHQNWKHFSEEVRREHRGLLSPVESNGVMVLKQAF